MAKSILLICAIVHLAILAIQGQVTRDTAWVSLKLSNAIRTDGVISVLNLDSITQCSLRCLRNPACVGISFGKYQYYVQHECTLHHGEVVYSYMLEPAFNYYQILPPM